MKACPYCAEEIQDTAILCRHCNMRLDAPSGPAAPPPAGPDLGMRLLLPVGRSGWAIAAGYLGLFSFLIIFAPIALAISIIACIHLKKHPELHGWGRAIFGLVAGIIMTVVFGMMMASIVTDR